MEACHKPPTWPQVQAAEPVSPATDPIPSAPHHINCSFSAFKFFCYLEDDLHKHRRHSHREAYCFRCNRCPFVGDTSEKLGMHHACVHLGGYIPMGENVILLCYLCTYISHSWADFFAHIHKHPTNKFACNECQWVFHSPQLLNKHCISAHDTRHFGCGYCMSDFINNNDLCAHVREHQIECIICHQCFLFED